MPTAAPHAVADKASVLGKKPALSAGKAAARKPSILKPTKQGPFARMQHAKKAGGIPSDVTPEDRRKEEGLLDHSKARKALPLTASGGSGSSQRTKTTTPFSLFFKHNLNRIKSEFPGLSTVEQMDKLNDEWGSLPMAEKAQYEEQAESLAVEAAAAVKTPPAKSKGASGPAKGKTRAPKAKDPNPPRKRPANAAAAKDQHHKRLKPPDQPPSTAISPFKVFRDENRHIVKEQFPHLTKEARLAKLKEQYRALDAEAQLRYKKEADARNAAAGLASSSSPLKNATNVDANDDGDKDVDTPPADHSSSADAEAKDDPSKKISPKKPSGTGKVSIRDFFQKSDKKPAADLKPLTSEQLAKLEKEKQKNRMKLMTKKEKEDEKERLKAAKALEREKIKKRREEEKKRRREAEKKEKLEELERQKPREDTDPKVLSESKPLPDFEVVVSRMPDNLFGDVVMLAEFVRTFAPAFASLPRERVLARDLEDAILQDRGDDGPHKELLTLTACFVVVAFEVAYGPDSCAFDTDLSIQLRDLPVNMHTASDVLRLYLIQMGYAVADRNEDEEDVRSRAEAVQQLETTELASLSPRQIVDILKFLSIKAFSNSHFMDKVEDAIERIPQIRKEQMELAREEQREKKATEEAAKKRKADVESGAKPLDADAALAALLFEKENSRSSRRVTRRLEETPEEKAAREALEEIERKKQRAEERKERRIALAEEVIEHKTRLKGRVFGFDRNWSQYRLLASLPGLIVQEASGNLRIITSVDDLDNLIGALNERGIREKSLKEKLLENRDEIEESLRTANKPETSSEDGSDGHNTVMPEDAIGSAAEAVPISDAGSAETGVAMSVDDPANAQEIANPMTLDVPHEATSVSNADGAPSTMSTQPSAMVVDDAETKDSETKSADQSSAPVEASATAIDSLVGIDEIAGGGGASEEEAQASFFHHPADEAMFAALKVDVTAFYDKIHEGGFGVPEREQWMQAMRKASCPAAVSKCLMELEDYIALQYLQKPLGHQRETSDAVAPIQLSSWRQYGAEAASSSKVSLLYELLYESIRWDKSTKSIKCKVCRRSTDEQDLLLCDGCNQGFHTFCLKPKLFEIPPGDWFCVTCKPPVLSGRAAKRNAMAMLSHHDEAEFESGGSAAEADSDYVHDNGGLNDDFVDSLCAVCSAGGEVLCCDTCPLVYHLECVGLRRAPRGEWRCNHCQNPKRTRTRARARSAMDGEIDFDFDWSNLTKGDLRNAMSQCDEILRLLRKHEAAWPFLEPVDTEDIPDYLEVVREPMDLQTIKDKLESLSYSEPGSFCADVNQIFKNCEMYNSPKSEEGEAGNSLKRYFEKLYRDLLAPGKKH